MKRHEADKLTSYFNNAGILLSTKQKNAFEIFYSLLIAHNEELDLSRLKKFDDIIVKHFIDSIYILKLFDLPASLLDIGTGAGFPGIPLAIMRPECQIILAEPRYKRVNFMEMAIKELGLNNTEIYPHLVTDKSFFAVKGVITRALESIDDTMARVNHFLPENGLVLFMKGPGAVQDISDISENNRKFFIIEQDIPYTLPGTDFERRLVVARKTAPLIARNFTIMRNQKENIGKPISSSDNSTFKELKKIASNTRKGDLTLITGKKIITDYLNNERNEQTIKEGQLQLILFDGYVENDTDFLKIITEFESKSSLFILKKSLFSQIDVLNAHAPILIAPKPYIKEWDQTIPAGCTLAIPFQDPANVGSVIRSAAGLGINNIIMLEGSASPYHPRSIRTSSGAVFSINIHKGMSIIELYKICKDNKINISILDSQGSDIRSHAFPESFILLPGTEGKGVPPELKSAALAIPLSPEVESLNAAIAASLAMYEWKGRTS